MPIALLRHLLDGIEHLTGFDAISIAIGRWWSLRSSARDGRIETVDGVVVALGGDIEACLERLGIMPCRSN